MNDNLWGTGLQSSLPENNGLPAAVLGSAYMRQGESGQRRIALGKSHSDPDSPDAAGAHGRGRRTWFETIAEMQIVLDQYRSSTRIGNDLTKHSPISCDL